jgi:peptidoglycan hydrolase-like protein with peptidoglycan-binding domain
MRKVTLTMLASAALAMPAVLPATAANQPNQQTPALQQTNSPQQQANQRQANQPNAQKNQQVAISPRRLGRSSMRRVQQALDKDGFHAGRADGVLGTKTRTALTDFQKSKGIQSTGQLDNQTLSDLGVRVASNQSMRNQNNMSHHNMGNQNNMSRQNKNNSPARNQSGQ